MHHSTRSFISIRINELLIVKFLHFRKVFISDTNDDQAGRFMRHFDDKVQWGGHVVDAAICEDHENEVFALSLVLVDDWVEFLQGWLEIGWAHQSSTFHRILIGFQQLCGSLHLRTAQVILVRSTIQAP